MNSLSDLDWDNWEARDPATLVFVFQGDEVLLINKKTGLGKGKVNAQGAGLKILKLMPLGAKTAACMQTSPIPHNTVPSSQAATTTLALSLRVRSISHRRLCPTACKMPNSSRR